MLSYLYQPRVADARLRDVLKALNTALGAIVRSTPQPMLRPQGRRAGGADSGKPGKGARN